MANVDLRNKVVVITGAARGIGLAAARLAAQRGARVALADCDFELARAEAQAIDGARAFEVDVRNRQSFLEMLTLVEQWAGAIHALINNAGVMGLGSLTEVREKVVRDTLEVNLLGVAHGMQLALPQMQTRGSGHVINLASIAGKWGVPGENVYSATKFGIVGLSEVARAELHRTGVHVSVALMGPTRTEFASGMDIARAVSLIEPETVAAALVRGLERPRFEIWVPRHLGWVEAAVRALPRGIRESMQRAMGVGAVATRVDWEARRKYENRAFGRVPPSRRGGQSTLEGLDRVRQRD